MVDSVIFNEKFPVSFAQQRQHRIDRSFLYKVGLRKRDGIRGTDKDSFNRKSPEIQYFK